jgi:Cu(I)/Ag(I) efflux system membrane fusion protein
MKSSLSLFRPLGFLLAAGLLTAAVLLVPHSARAAGAGRQLYTCGMHPQIIRDAPGNCPICGMKLQPVRANTAKAGAATAGERKIKYYKSTMIPGQVSEKPGKDTMGMDMVPVYEGEDSQTNAIQIDAATVQRMNLKTALVTRGPVRREFRTVATVTFNEEGYRDITTKYEGWLEKLHVNATWSTVKEGDPLFEIYSPDLYNAELNYLVARRSEGNDGGALTRAARTRLQLLDLPADEIAELDRSGEVPRTRVFRAPAAGVVIEKMAVVGQMMKPGERTYRMADLSTVWVVAQIYESDLPFVQEGQTATVRTTYGATRTYTGQVGRLLPQVEDQTRTVSARIVVPNADGFLRPGMFTDVKFVAQLAESAVLVPEIAVLRSGERNTVFVALDGGSFEPREVKLGNRSEGGNYEVLSGLVGGERIVTSGQFMLDSESQLREAIQKMLKGDTAGATPAAGGPAAAVPDGTRKIKFYRSTMMPGETSPNPGKDSMGMDMVPVYEDGAANSAAGHQP